MTTLVAATIDVRMLAPRDRHATIFGRLDALRPGEAITLVNDHNPLPLRYQLEDRAAGQFEWAALESGPDVWRVQISRSANGPATNVGSSCCSGGACGG